MSIFELLLIAIVCFIVLKPEDLPLIIRKLLSIRRDLIKTKEEFISYINLSEISDGMSADEPTKQYEQEDIEQMNFYLAKIASLGYEYQGEYSLQIVKDYYESIISSKISDMKQIPK